MPADPDSELLAGFVAMLPHVPGYALTASLALWMFKLGRRIGAVESDIEQGEKADTKGETERRAADERIVKLEIQVAALPTRDEMRAMFGEVREDIRELRGPTAAPDPKRR